MNIERELATSFFKVEAGI